MRITLGGRRGSAPMQYEPLKSPFHRPQAARNTIDVTFATMCLLVLGLIGITSLSFIAGQHLQVKTPGDVLNCTAPSARINGAFG